MKNSIQKDNIEKTKLDLNIVVIIAGIIIECFCFPIWVIEIVLVQQPAGGLAYIYVFVFTILVAIGIGLILYGIIKILKEKNLLSNKSIKTLKLISNLVVYIGLALLILSLALEVLFIFLDINTWMISTNLPILSFFLIILGCGITSPDNGKSEGNGKEKI